MLAAIFAWQTSGIALEVRELTVSRGVPARTRPLREAMAEHHVGSLDLTVFEGGKIVASLHERLPGHEGSVYQAGSLSKPLAAVLALRMVDERRLTLDGPLARHLGNWQLPESVFTEKSKPTLRQVLSHTAGFGLSGFPGYRPGVRLPNLRQMLDGIEPANSPAMIFEAAPGTKWKYSGGGYLVLQQAIESSGRTSYALEAERSIFDWAAMTASGFEPRGRPNSAHDGLGEPLETHVYPELTAAGLWTTSEDYARFLIAIPSLLSKATFVEFVKPGIGGCGLGVAVKDGWLFHTGRNRGFDSSFIASSDCRRGLVAMIDGNNDTGFLDEVADAVFRSRGWTGGPKFEVREVESVPESHLDGLSGRYGNDAGQVAEVKRDRFRLFLKRPDTAGWTAITPKSKTQFEGAGLVVEFRDGELHLGTGRRKVVLKKQ